MIVHDFFKIGPLNIELKNESRKSFQFFQKYFQGIRLDHRPDKIDIEVRILNDPGNFIATFYSSGIKIADDSFYKFEDAFDFSVENLFNDKKAIITVYPKTDEKKLKYKYFMYRPEFLC